LLTQTFGEDEAPPPNTPEKKVNQEFTHGGRPPPRRGGGGLGCTTQNPLPSLDKTGGPLRPIFKGHPFPPKAKKTPWVGEKNSPPLERTKPNPQKGGGGNSFSVRGKKKIGVCTPGEEKGGKFLEIIPGGWGFFFFQRTRGFLFPGKKKKKPAKAGGSPGGKISLFQQKKKKQKKGGGGVFWTGQNRAFLYGGKGKNHYTQALRWRKGVPPLLLRNNHKC